MIQKIKKGQLLRVTCDKTIFKGYKDFYEVVSTNVRRDSFGPIKLKFVATIDPQERLQKFTERFSVVEKLWFDEKLTDRKIQIINEFPFEL